MIHHWCTSLRYSFLLAHVILAMKWTQAMIPFTARACMLVVTVMTLVTITTWHTTIPVEIGTWRPIDPQKPLRLRTFGCIHHCETGPRLSAVCLLMNKRVLALAVDWDQICLFLAALYLSTKPTVHSILAVVEWGAPIAEAISKNPFRVWSTRQRSSWWNCWWNCGWGRVDVVGTWC